MSKSTKSSTKKERTRNYSTIVYPESAPKDWQNLLADQCVGAFISPLHNKDLCEKSEHEVKKEHYHVIIMFDGPKSESQAQSLFDIIGGVGVKPVVSIRGYARYLCHLDNPDKYQYDTSEVRCLGGSDYFSTIGLPTSKYDAIIGMMDYCKSNDIYSYAELLEYSAIERYDWFRTLCDNGTLVIKEYLKSRSWVLKMQHEQLKSQGKL